MLTALNKAFPMEQQNGKFFTIWYGVIDRQDKQLTYSGGGHPPSVLISGNAGGPLKQTALKGDGLMVGAVDGLDLELIFDSAEPAPSPPSSNHP